MMPAYTEVCSGRAARGISPMRYVRLSALLLLCVLPLFSREVTITVLATTDMHGNIYPYDYLTGKEAQRGLAKIATLIHAERKANPDSLLIDAGDTIQGAPLESVWQQYVRTGKLPLHLRFPDTPPRIDPMMLVMNHLGYDAMTLGNHEFNFGLDNMEKARAAARFPWLSANTKASGARKPFDAYTVKTVGGVKVAILGLTTPAVPSWEKPENLKDFEFTDAKAAAARAVAELRAKHRPDLIVAAIHAGLERDPKTGEARPGAAARENMVYQIATEVAGIDAIVFGHTHQTVEELRLGQVLITQPKNWAMSLARLRFTLESKSGGGYRVVSKSSQLLPVTAGVPADPEVLRLAAPYHEITERFLNTKVTESAVEMSAAESRVEDTPIIDAIHQVQLHAAKADVSFTASFNPRAAIPKGPVTVRQIAALYIYDNELYAIEGTGKMVREALENAARYFQTCPDPSCSRGPLINRSFIGFNYDMAQGVSYDIDLTRPVGERIRNLRFRGKPLAGDQKLRIALNNYRAGGSGGYRMFRDAPVLWRSYEDIRELIIRYYSGHKLPSQADGNWRIVPEAAHRRLEQEARGEAGRVSTQ